MLRPRRPLRFDPLEDRTTPYAALDRGYGYAAGSGPAAVPIDGPDWIYLQPEVAALPDGRALVAVSSPNEGLVAVRRFGADGALDASYGTGGVTVVDARAAGFQDVTLTSAAARPDGGLVLLAQVSDADAGRREVDQADIAVLEITADGHLDPAFGAGGWVVVPFGSDPATYGAAGESSNFDSPLDLAVDAAGRVVVGATVNGAYHTKIGVARLTPTGGLDAAFDGDGVQAIDLGPGLAVVRAGQINDIGRLAVLPDGSVVAVAAAEAFPPGDAGHAVRQLTAVKLAADGTPDTAFGTNGRAGVVFSLGGEEYAVPAGLAVAPDGGLLVAASVLGGSDTGYDFGVVRLTPAGDPDPAFGTGGVVTVGFDRGGRKDDTVARLFVGTDGAITLAGRAEYQLRSDECYYISLEDLAAVRLHPDGTPDEGFGPGGRFVARFSPFLGEYTDLPFAMTPGGTLLFTRVETPPGPWTSVPGPDGQPVPTPESRQVLGLYRVVPDAPVQPEWPPVPPPVVSNPYPIPVVQPVVVPADPPSPPVTEPAVPPADPPPAADLPAPAPAVTDIVVRGTVPIHFAPPAEPELPPATVREAPPVSTPATPEASLQPPAPILPSPVVPLVATTVRLTAVGGLAGGTPDVTVYNPDGSVRFTLPVFEPTFTGGVATALADVNGDGVDDVVASAGDGGGPRVRVFDGATGAALADFFAFDDSWRGGVSVAVGADGRVVAGAGAGGGPRVRVFRGSDGTPVADFFAYEDGFRGGVFVAAGDVTGDGVTDVIAGAGAGGSSRVRVFDGATGAAVSDLMAGDPDDRGGVRVAVRDVPGTGRVVVARTTAGDRAFDPTTGDDLTGRVGATALIGGG